MVSPAVRTDASTGLAERTPVLSVDALRTVYHVDGRAIVAADGVSFDLYRGEVLALVGESGCGKSATLLSLVRLIRPPGRVVNGRVVFDGRDLLSLPERELRRLRGSRIAMIHQDPGTSLNPLLRVGTQMTEMIRTHRGLTRAHARARALDLLTSVGIPDPPRTIDSYPHQLSGGMRQRVGIAMALSCDPDILLADEPTTALDVTLQSQILDLIRHEQQARQMAVIFVSHDLGVVARIADRIGVVYGGRLVELGAAEHVLGSPAHPYTALLIGSIPQVRGPSTGRRLKVIPGQPPTVTATKRSSCLFFPRCPNVGDRCDREDPLLQTVPGRPQLAACWHPWQRKEP